MTTKDEALTAIAETRASYKDFRDRLEAEIVQYRASKTARWQGALGAQIAEAFSLGASIAELKRAYGTTDYKTIKNFIESAEAQPIIEAPRAEPEKPWFQIIDPDTVDVGDASYMIIELDDGEDLMLELIEGEDELKLDGALESERVVGSQSWQLFQAIRNEGEDE